VEIRTVWDRLASGAIEAVQTDSSRPDILAFIRRV
jgi:hypothetical protein